MTHLSGDVVRIMPRTSRMKGPVRYNESDGVYVPLLSISTHTLTCFIDIAFFLLNYLIPSMAAPNGLSGCMVLPS